MYLRKEINCLGVYLSRWYQPIIFMCGNHSLFFTGLRYSVNCVTISRIGLFCKCWYNFLSLRCSWVNSRYSKVGRTTTMSPSSAQDITRLSYFTSWQRASISPLERLGPTRFGEDPMKSHFMFIIAPSRNLLDVCRTLSRQSFMYFFSKSFDLLIANYFFLEHVVCRWRISLFSRLTGHHGITLYLND